MTSDGRVRYARGAERRSALVSAAADVLLEQGFAALSHRAVAVRAGLPLASTTYYFASVEELRDEALHCVAELWLARGRAALDALPERLDRASAAEAVVAVLGADAPHEQQLVLYERYLEAGRHERLRPLVVSWNARLGELVRELLLRAALPAGEGEVDLVLAVTDGAAVTALAEGAPPADAVRTALGRLLQLF
jgi:DNA-binding transcriptional regulator YbjK